MLSLLFGVSAQASVSDGFALGVGTGLGVHSSTSAGAAEGGVVGDINLRGRFLWILGLDWRYSLQDKAELVPGDSPQYAAKFRTTALIYPIPTPVVSFYLGAGIGATEFSELLQVGAEGASYHAGVGLEWAIEGMLVLDASFFMIVPGYRSVERDIERRAGLEVAAYQADPSGSTASDSGNLSVGDYVSVDNFELMFRAMMVF